MRLTALLSPIAFTLLATAMAGLGAIAWPEALWAAAAVVLAFAATGWRTPTAVRRRIAEASLVPAAFALTMVGDPAMRRMVVPPLLLIAIWAAGATAWKGISRGHRPLVAALLGLAARAAVGLGLAGCSAFAGAAALAVAAVLPWMAARRWGRRAAEFAALLGAVLPWQNRPLVAVALVGIAVAVAVTGRGRDRDVAVAGWIPGVGAAALLAAALAPWPGLAVSDLFTTSGWVTRAVIVAAFAITLRLRPGAAGVVWLAATLCLGPVKPPSPEQRAFELTAELGELRMSAGTGQPYVVDLDVVSPYGLDRLTPLAVLRFADQDHSIPAVPVDGEVVWRPQGLGAGTKWRAVSRSRFTVPRGERPVLFRAAELPSDVVVRVETIGAVRATPPRDWLLPRWLLAAAAAVAVIEVAARTWQAGSGAIPWLLLVFGSMVARAPVEPLRLLGERLAVDLALAALVAAWLPAARVWLRQRRVFAAAAAMLVPLALATPHLTPPLYGDEPFHLTVMESLAGDRDLDITDDLDLENHPQNQLYAPGRPLFHSPALGVLLLPGYLAAGRTGALVLLALMGAATAALIARRSRDLGLQEWTVGVLVLVLVATYPMAVFSTQIWPELPGALAVAALLVLAARRHGGRWSALVVTATAVAIKTRLGLLTLPIAAAAWLRRRPLWGLLALSLATVAALAIGWLTMGHPFGPYRRLHHLLPTDAGLAARVLGGLAFDAAGGLAFTAPLLLGALAGIGLLWRRGGVGERALLIGCGLTVLALLHSPEWYGGGAPPARYLIPMLPAFALAGGLALTHPTGRRRLLPILLPPSAVAWWAMVTRPHLSINPGDGGYWLADALSRRFTADGRSLFPSFLVVDTATFVVPAMLVVVAVSAVWMATRWVGAGRRLGGAWIAVWLAAAAALVLTIGLRADNVVEAEAPQVRRSGGGAVPPPGTVARYSHRRGWRLENGDRVVVPLHLRDNVTVILEGWLLGTARRRAELELVWDDRDPVVVAWRGDGETERLGIAAPPGGGRHRLGITLRSPPNGAVVLDRLVIDGAADP